MNKDQNLGWIVLLGSFIGIATYFYLTFYSPWILLTLQISAFLTVATILLILAWIGYTLATTSQPLSIEELENLQEKNNDKEINIIYNNIKNYKEEYIPKKRT